ncbi:hypothetical protein CROQUDRAFT_471366 [Cronartium quercuum f. sp. fusiforme G11]|uniref:Uncharacterized protein n=1 Tax=Cronartium quercuum f. sp. fusiforme G11 TaxID=708437 RepID=A0A9P6NPS8_9BASI|nr:hypothetical protein CROQUDRAFT_471366 [Cronartium quercuum f. sp. fusiforme G11]
MMSLHPISRWLSQISTSNAIISSHLPLSFVFHISLNILSSQDAVSHSRVVVVGRSKAAFDELIDSEADAQLANLGSQPALFQLLERLEFCFCDGLSQLVNMLQALAHLHAQPQPTIDHQYTIPPARPPAPIAALILIDPCSYLAWAGSPSSSASSSPLIMPSHPFHLFSFF